MLLQLLLHRRLLQRAAQIGAELFLMLAQVHRLCNAVLINAQLGSIGRICASRATILLTGPANWKL